MNVSWQADDWPESGRRRGFLLLIAMVVLVIATALFAVWIRTALVAARALRDQEHRMQAEWLVESAFERAIAQLRTNRGYTGEVWQLPAAEITQRGDGRADIQVRAVGGSRTRWQVRARAHYPSDRGLPATYSKQIELNLPSRGAT